MQKSAAKEATFQFVNENDGRDMFNRVY